MAQSLLVNKDILPVGRCAYIHTLSQTSKKFDPPPVLALFE